jgi:rhamnosyltransferase subunit B
MTKRIVFAVWGSLGDLHPYLAIARELQARGHHCVIATTNFHRERVETSQLEFAPLGPHLDADAALMRDCMHLHHGPQFLLRDVLIPYTWQSFEDTMSAIKGADLLVTHPITYGAHLAAQKSGILWVSTVLAPLGMFSNHEPSFRVQMPLLSKLPMGLWLDRALMKLVRYSTSKWTKPIAKFRTELGLPTGANAVLEGQFSPELTLALFSPLFGRPQPDWPPNTVITGFPFYDEPAEMDTRLNDFLSEGDPPVVFTLGSAASMAPGKFFDESLKAISKLNWRAVLIVGLYGPNQFSDALPKGVAAFPYAPYEQLFPRAAVTVHHGGIGTTAQALRSGRPMLVVPFAFDQPDNAARAKKLGVGRSLFIHQYDGARAARELEPLLNDSSYGEKASAVGEQVRRENGVSNAANELHKLLLK